MPVPVQVQAFWQCPYRYWHFCQLCQYQYGHFTYANTGIGIFLMPIQVLASFFQQCQYQYRHFGNAHTGTGIFANRANTSTGIFPMPILVLIFSQCLYRYWHLQCDARTGNFYFCQSCQYQYGHFQYQYGDFFIPILVLVLSFTVPIPVWSYISWPFSSFLPRFCICHHNGRRGLIFLCQGMRQIIWQVEQNESEY
jgi:hypothetical protein